jgi:hypothetical protein
MKKFKRIFSRLLIAFLTFGIIVLLPGRTGEVYAANGVSWKLKSGISITVNKTWELKTPDDVSEVEIQFSSVEFVLSAEHEYNSETDVTRTYNVGDITYTLEPVNSYGYVQSYSVSMSNFKLTSEEGWTKTLNFPDLTADIGEGYYLINPGDCYEYINGETQDDANAEDPDSPYLVTFDSPSITGGDYDAIYNDFTINVLNVPNYVGGYALILAKQWPSDIPPEDITIEIYQDNVLFGELNLNSSLESLSGSDFLTNYGGYIDQDTLGIIDDSEIWYKTGIYLPKDNGSGHEYEYTYKESGSTYRYEVNTQQVSNNNDDFLFVVVTNQEQLIDITVTKTWEGAEGAKAVVHLFAGDQEIDSAELTSGSWTHVFTGLPETDENGDTIEYSVTEDAVSGYTTEITGSAQDGFLITNTEEITPTPEGDTEESPKTSEKKEVPQTGDDAHFDSYALIIIGAMMAAVVMTRKRIMNR